MPDAELDLMRLVRGITAVEGAVDDYHAMLEGLREAARFVAPRERRVA